jgi:anaerobic magnesium-protoporphyrin IX monomethyl ester cyclase
MTKQRFVLVAQNSSIEPLGILHLTGTVRDAGWDCVVVLISGDNYEPLYKEIQVSKPDLVGFQIWTGNHLGAFKACDAVRALGVPVLIGGPHATYFHEECAKHAEWTIRASGFGFLTAILADELPHGIHFNLEGRKEHFPFPNRDLLYSAYSKFGASPIKSMFCSVGCPYKCTYCYAPVFNAMHGGFSLTTRLVDDLVQEACAIIDSGWPLELIYFQDDVFGFKIPWLREFAEKWKKEVGVPFHAQMRLEMTQHASGIERLDLMRQAGCSGVTLAIESGDQFLRDHVLFRHMDRDLIVEGCKRITDRGMTLRTEQILGVPFSNLETELATLALNADINPTMAWVSILSPYGGTAMGTIAERYGFYAGNNDDLADNFFDRSVLSFNEGGPRDIEVMVAQVDAKPTSQILTRLTTKTSADGTITVFDPEGTTALGTLNRLGDEANERYRRDLVRLQRLFNFLAKCPQAAELGRKLVELPDADWTWETIGRTVENHLRPIVGGARLVAWKEFLAHEMGLPSHEHLPPSIAANPWFFCVVPSGGAFAQTVVKEGLFNPDLSTSDHLDRFATLGRHHLFHYGLYTIEGGPDPIATFSVSSKYESMAV